MKPLFHLINIVLWMLVPLVVVFIFSFPFDFSYWNAVQSSGFGFIYFLYCIGAICAYGISTGEGIDSMHFLPIKQ